MTASTNAASQLEHTIGSEGRFALRLPSGSVTIRGTDGDVARVRDVNGRPLGERFEIAMGDGSLELSVRQKFGFSIAIGSRGFGDHSPELAVDLPRGASVSIDTASADVVARGLTGSKHFHTASGDLRLEEILGELEIEAVSGDTIIAGDGSLVVRARSISGDFRLRAPQLGRFEMSTTSGDIEIDAEMAGSGPYAIKSISGDVRLVTRAGLQVEAQTITGDLSSAIPHKTETQPGKKLLIVGKPVATLTFKSVSGDLEIVEPREGVAIHRALAPDAPSESIPVDAPAAPTPPAPPTPPMPAAAPLTSSMQILEALERGEISVEDASRQLAALEEA
jgi:hypothetical protein